MKSERISIHIAGDEYVSAVVSAPDTDNENTGTGLIFAHGAANDMDHPLIVAAAEGLAEMGFVCLRFNFLYREKGRKSPDSQGKLVQTWRGVYDYIINDVSHKIEKVIAVGKSMGGRVASQMVADGQMDVHRMIFLGYPLHAPGRKDKLKDVHLYHIKVPLLFIAGTRDPLCDLNSLGSVLQKLKCQWELEIIKGGDHSFKLPKTDSRKDHDIYTHVLHKCVKWLRSA